MHFQMKNIKSKVLASCCQNYISSLNDNTNDNTIASCNDSKFSFEKISCQKTSHPKIHNY